MVPVTDVVPESAARPASLQAAAMLLLWLCRTYACRSFVPICSAPNLFFGIGLLFPGYLLSVHLVPKMPVVSLSAACSYRFQMPRRDFQTCVGMGTAAVILPSLEGVWRRTHPERFTSVRRLGF